MNWNYCKNVHATYFYPSIKALPAVKYIYQALPAVKYIYQALPAVNTFSIMVVQIFLLKVELLYCQSLKKSLIRSFCVLWIKLIRFGFDQWESTAGYLKQQKASHSLNRYHKSTTLYAKKQCSVYNSTLKSFAWSYKN